MYADLAIAPPLAERRGVSLMTVAFAVAVVLWSMHAFYFVFAQRPDDAMTAAAPSARDNLSYVAVWCLLYCAAAIVTLRDAWQRGIALRLLALAPFAVLVVLSSLWANEPRSSLIFATMLALNVVIAAALAATVPPRLLLSIIAWTVVALSAVSLLMLLVDPASVVSDAGRPGLLMSGELVGVFGHKAAMGLYAALALLILIFMDRSRWFWRATGIAIVAVALMLSNAMAASVNLVVVCCVLFVAARAGQRRELVVVVAAMSAIAFSAILPFLDLSWLSETLGRGATFTGRTGMWSLAPGFIAERPLLGFGYHSFFDATPFSQVWSLRATEEYFFTPNFHNSMLETLIGLGLVGAVGYLAILVTANLAFLNRTLDRRLALVLAGTMILLTLVAATDVTFLAHNALSTVVLFYAFLVAGRDYG